VAEIWMVEEMTSVFFFAHRLLVFFFSSRRRHTRCLSDWSSDVCSSDLELLLAAGARTDLADADGVTALRHAERRGFDAIAGLLKIGRASCRERVEISGVAVGLKKKTRERS